jgi:hypothetical protein
MPDLVARRTITTIQAGSKYRERWTLPDSQPEETTTRQVFLDSAGGEIATIEGVVDGRIITFDSPYTDVEAVPNGAGFYTYIQRPEDLVSDDEVMVKYGSVFRRELTFPNSPAEATSTVVKKFADDFQRPPGAVGGRWKTLVGRPTIFDNGVKKNSVGPKYTFFSRYFCYYYIPFNDDTVDLTISLWDKGSGKTIVTLCQNSTATSYLYCSFDGDDEEARLGFGTGPDIGSVLSPSSVLQPQEGPFTVDIPTVAGAALPVTYKLSYDDDTKEFALYNADRTVKHLSWVDDSEIVPHGKGYRYFGIGGNSSILDSGIQVASIAAAGAV